MEKLSVKIRSTASSASVKKIGDVFPKYSEFSYNFLKKLQKADVDILGHQKKKLIHR